MRNWHRRTHVELAREKYISYGSRQVAASNIGTVCRVGCLINLTRSSLLPDGASVGGEDDLPGFGATRDHLSRLRNEGSVV